MNKRARAKGILSTILLAAFILAALSGLALWIYKGGLVLGLPRAYWKWAHHAGSLLMLLGVPLHFILNRKLYRAELKRRATAAEDRHEAA